MLPIILIIVLILVAYYIISMIRDKEHGNTPYK